MTRTRIAIIAGVLAGIGLLAWAMRPRPVDVEVATVTQGSFEQVIEDDGKLRLRERYVVSAPVAGDLQRIVFKVGDRVLAGATVATILPAAPGMIDARTRRELEERVGSADAQMGAARAGLLRAKAAAEQAVADLARQRKLAEQGFVASAVLDQAALATQVQNRAVEASKAELDAAQHQAAMARAALARSQQLKDGEADKRGRFEVRAPVEGRVVKLMQESGGAVALGTPLLELGDPSRLEAVIDVLSTEAVRIRPGSLVTLDVGGGAAIVTGLVRHVEPTAFTKVSALGVEEQRVNVIVDPNPAQVAQLYVGDGFRVDARIVIASRPQVAKVPSGSLFRDGNQWAVFVVEGGRAVKRNVKVGERNSAEAVIDSGLKVGESVVVYPGESVAEGKRVKVGKSAYS